MHDAHDVLYDVYERLIVAMDIAYDKAPCVFRELHFEVSAMRSLDEHLDKLTDVNLALFCSDTPDDVVQVDTQLICESRFVYTHVSVY